MNQSSTFRCVCIGEASLLIQCSQYLFQNGHEIVALVTDTPDYIAWGTDNNLTVLPFDQHVVDGLAQKEFDYLFSIANLKILPEALLEMPKLGAFNFHDGPLPEYAGLYTTSWAIINQEAAHGVTWHSIEVGIDTGEIAAQERFELAPDETAFSLNVKCFEAGMRTFEQLVDHLAADSLMLRPQVLDQRTYFAKRLRPKDGAVLDWGSSAQQLDALVRGLDFGQAANPLLSSALLWRDQIWLVPALNILSSQTEAAPGTVVAIQAAGLIISTGTKDVQIPQVLTPAGERLAPQAFAEGAGLSVGDQLGAPHTAGWDRLISKAVKDEAQWVALFEDGLIDIEIPYIRTGLSQTVEPQMLTVRTQLPAIFQSVASSRVLAAVALYLSRLSTQGGFHLALQTDQEHPLFASRLPLLVSPAADTPVTEALNQLQATLDVHLGRPGYFRDVFLRYPSLSSMAADYHRLPLSCVLIDGNGSAGPLEASLGIAVQDGELVWHYDPTSVSEADLYEIQSQFQTFLMGIVERPDQPLAKAAILSPEKRHQMLVEWNQTDTAYPKETCIHTLFEAQVAQTPDQTALIYQTQVLTYAELDRLANQVAHHLLSLGVKPDQMIGVYMDRSVEMLVGLLGILKAGGAYLPLDPTYPADRLNFMVADTATPVILTEPQYLDQLPPHQAAVVSLDLAKGWDLFESYPTEPVNGTVAAEHLAYIIYTSGSTGKPKGVMVEHRNAVNFFAGMDDRIPHQPGDTWLAVTSLSFDISVLELFWSLTRGLRVVLYSSKGARQGAVTHKRSIDFGLFYFSSDASDSGQTGKYDLLIEGAKYADKHHFSSVWTPERHFDAFGGLYPNPAVTGAAIAAITQNVRILAGSCVLPLHHPVRVAEEWSVVDNLSNGRVGISFAAGWQPNDFLLQPQNFEDRKTVMFDQIEMVKKLWRGETVSFEGPKGAVEAATLPRPVQPELPIWVTAASNPETFRMAGEGGFYILTHLLGQSVAEVGEKLRLYREGWRKSGKPGSGHVTIMLHTFVGNDPEMVREVVRQPLIDYLRSSLFLIKKASWSFPTFKEKASETGQSPLEIFESQDLTNEEMEALLEHAFDRYYEESGLLGTIDKCREMVTALRDIGVDEIACQIDFGVTSSLVLNHLAYLNDLRAEFSSGGHVVIGGRLDQAPLTIPELIKTHQVTHFQCTPSMMRMLLLDDEMRTGLNQLQVCMLGGEALPRVLADEVLDHLSQDGRLVNMYGPTETTIWSSTSNVGPGNESITIGRPIANTALYIVDENLEPVPVGQAGELLIGGDGVVRGYWQRETLTAERFILDPFKADGVGRVYRTGDLARFRQDGTVEFLGRLDFQVKIRGYRIELGEIESLLNRHVDVREAVVVAREDRPGDKRLIAYILGRKQFEDEAILRAHLKETLPDFMVPSHFIFMDRFPLTPNKKTDRKALPSPFSFKQKAAPAVLEQSTQPIKPQPISSSHSTASISPPHLIEKEIAEIWKPLLGIDSIGRHDNFFEIGGHSILAVQAHRQMRETLNVDLSIADLFRYATLAELGAFLGDQHAVTEQVQQAALDRVIARREALAHRVRGRRKR